ncbi:sperm axonemal maintenance protein CFAP97D1 isoform X2 [Hyla sarda]|uniref:sperm axonemal maintenance protein CFAP97D1 isoform X2 n=1 Tax=Hyla sarda TaxID=327740 RepID=UPI0024C45893|nr:sperm axonemal maintenance protein CFAP97D1 isoform X2 [Hyla sarda]
MSRSWKKSPRWFGGQMEQKRERERFRSNFAKPEIDNKPPRIFLHPHVQLRKIQMEQERLAVIEKDNRRLMEKIAHIMRTGGEVDNWNNSPSISLKSSRRNREIVRITVENQAIHKRIQDSKPNYDNKKREDEWKGTRKHLQHLSSYHTLAKDKPSGLISSSYIADTSRSQNSP